MVLWPRENQARPNDQRSCCTGVALILFRGSLETLTFGQLRPWRYYRLGRHVRLDCLYFVGSASFAWRVFHLTHLPVCRGRRSLQPSAMPARGMANPQAVISAHAFLTYLFLAIVPGIGAYAGFVYLGAKFGSVRASLVTYVLPISIVVLSILFLGEGPAVYHIVAVLTRRQMASFHAELVTGEAGGACDCARTCVLFPGVEAQRMSAIGLADIASCTAHVRFRGVKRTCLFALHLSAFDGFFLRKDRRGGGQHD